MRFLTVSNLLPAASCLQDWHPRGSCLARNLPQNCDSLVAQKLNHQGVTICHLVCPKVFAFCKPSLSLYPTRPLQGVL